MSKLEEEEEGPESGEGKTETLGLNGWIGPKEGGDGLEEDGWRGKGGGS